jgi:hypothetical protein
VTYVLGDVWDGDIISEESTVDVAGDAVLDVLTGVLIDEEIYCGD